MLLQLMGEEEGLEEGKAVKEGTIRTTRRRGRGGDEQR